MSICGLKKLKYDIIPRLAAKASQEHGMTYHIAAIAFTKRGNFLDIAYNNHRMYMSHRKGAGRHAEQTLIHKWGKMIDTIYILRVGNAGKPLPIHACETCASIAKKVGIKIIPLHEEVNDLLT